MFNFWKNEWELFLEDLGSVKNMFKRFLGLGEPVLMISPPVAEPIVEEQEEMIVETANTTTIYEPDDVDHKVSAYFGEDIDAVRQNSTGDKTQHTVLREYAESFKPYTVNQEMCNSAFRKYYDRHALNIATSTIPVEQLRIIQNNVDIFIGGQEVFGEGSQFIDSRIDSVFEKVGAEQINKMVDILHDNAGETVNLQGERLFAEAVHYMVDNGIKLEKDGTIISPMKKVLEEKLNTVHVSLRNHEDWNDEYQQLLSDERKYLYALNRIEQYETEQRIMEFEQKFSEMELATEEA